MRRGKTPAISPRTSDHTPAPARLIAADYLDSQRPQQEEVDPTLRLEERLRLLPAPVEDEAPRRRKNG